MPTYRYFQQKVNFCFWQRRFSNVLIHYDYDNVKNNNEFNQRKNVSIFKLLLSKFLS